MNQELLFSFLFLVAAILFWHKGTQRRYVALAPAVLVLLSLLLIGAYLVSDSLSGAGIDESVIFHLKAGIKGAAFSDFYWQFSLGGVFLAGSITAAFLVYKSSLNSGEARHAGIRVLLAVLAFGASFTVSPALRDLAYLYKQSLYETRDAPEGFLIPGPIANEAPAKNFVILYLEQIERTYLDESLFPGLMPNFQALEKEALSFSNITQARGTSWSIAGMTAGFCGLPLVGAAATNSMSGMDQFMPGALCIGDLLDANGYQLEHLYGGDLDFAGWGSFFNTHGFDQVEGVLALAPLLPAGTAQTPWGLHDENLLALAESRFDTLAQTNAPFGLTVNTLDTHHPEGHPGPYCADISYGDGENQLLNTLHCADKMIAEFINDLRAKPAFSDMVLVVASDHLAMPNSIWDQLSNIEERRNIFMIFGPDIEPQLVDKAGSSFDVGVTMLNQMGIPMEGLGLGRNLMDDTQSLIEAEVSLDDIINQSAGFFSSLWSYPQLDDGVIANLGEKVLRLGDRSVDFPVLFTLNDDYSVNEANFDFYDGYPLPEKARNLWFYELFFWMDSCENIKTIAPAAVPQAAGFCAAAGALGSGEIKVFGLAEGGEISFAELRLFFDTVAPDEAVYEARMEDIALYTKFGTADLELYSPEGNGTGRYVIRSKGGYGLGESSIREVDTGFEVELERGFTVFGLSAGEMPVQLGYLDTCAYEIPPEELPPLNTDFAAIMAESGGDFGAYIIALHDSALCSRYAIAPLFEGTGLMRWAEIGPRSPYIAVISANGAAVEYVGARETALAIAAENIVTLAQ